MKGLWVVLACLAIFLIPGYSLHAEEQPRKMEKGERVDMAAETGGGQEYV